MEYIRVVLVDLPHRVHAFTVCTLDDGQNYYTVFLNARDSVEKQRKAYLHELEHIEKDDFYCVDSIENLEGMRHGA